MPSIEEVVATYIAAWSESDPAVRLDLLRAAWADDGVYSDPSAYVEGRNSLVEHVAGFQQQFPDHQLHMQTGIDTHHDCLRIEWGLVGPDGSAVVNGIDFATVAGDGRLQNVTGFFGPSPPLGS